MILERLILKRGDNNQCNKYQGQEGELAYDKTNKLIKAKTITTAVPTAPSIKNVGIIDTILDRINVTMEEHKTGFNRYERIIDKTTTVYPTSPESMFAAEYFKDFYKEKTKIKN